jgi:hypothetical protein
MDDRLDDMDREARELVIRVGQSVGVLPKDYSDEAALEVYNDYVSKIQSLANQYDGIGAEMNRIIAAFVGYVAMLEPGRISRDVYTEQEAKAIGFESEEQRDDDILNKVMECYRLFIQITDPEILQPYIRSSLFKHRNFHITLGVLAKSWYEHHSGSYADGYIAEEAVKHALEYLVDIWENDEMLVRYRGKYPSSLIVDKALKDDDVDDLKKINHILSEMLFWKNTTGDEELDLIGIGNETQKRLFGTDTDLDFLGEDSRKFIEGLLEEDDSGTE